MVLAAGVALAAIAPSAQGQTYRPRETPQRAQVVEAYGGLYEGAVASYVAQVGDRVAAAAGRAPGQCAFGVINSDVINAFAAPPSCSVYITRGLLSILNSEDELASVLGHEVGHVAANHAGRRQNRSALSGIGALLVGALTRSPELGQLAGQAAQLNILSYSRSQELEADSLGIRYLEANGYAPYALADMLDSLQANDQLDARARGREEAQATPAWGRTHPLTSERIARAAQQARQTAEGVAEREAPFLSAIDGMLYGDDPRQGFVNGRNFTHPDLGLAFTAPPGFALRNGPQSVKIEGPGGVSGQFGAGRAQGGRLDGYAYDVMQRLLGQTSSQVGQAEMTRINGLDAVILPARAQTQRGTVDVTVAAYSLGSDAAYHFVTLAPAGRGGVFEPLFGSFRRLSAGEATSVRPRRLEVVTVRPGDTVNSLASRMAVSDFGLERFRVLNGLAPGEPLRPGQRVKLVTTGRR
ncbi:M48 family metalloprotease [Phenylobacterium sp.]|uniref:M48 family metalloprotease n=1 Tax=Phenylobacterium sp. TaxID=1871053 RepID=UPI00398398E4